MNDVTISVFKKTEKKYFKFKCKPTQYPDADITLANGIETLLRYRLYGEVPFKKKLFYGLLYTVVVKGKTIL